VQKNDANLLAVKNVISENCTLTDVGSVKSNIHEHIKNAGLEKNFIGGHPMAGSERFGYQNSKVSLLENAYYILTPTPETDTHKLNAYKELVTATGAIPLILDYKQHDYVTAAISHLPHVIAASLVNLVKSSDSEDGIMKMVAGGGFKDITRIASSYPVMWENICITNQEQLLCLMDKYITSLQELREDISESKSKVLMDKFQSAKDYRDSISVSGIRSQNRIHELFLDLADEAGGIAIIASILAFKGISIKNIGIVHNREFEQGVLHIEFYDEEALELAAELLKEKNYVVYRR
jgi:prephenate dehydrogenase